MSKNITVLLSLLVACGQGVEPDAPEATAAFAAMMHPASCRDIGDGNAIPDGVYRLFLGNDPAKPWQAYCKDGAEYIMTSADAVCQAERTTYTHVRIDPETLMVDVSDQAFTSGACDANPRIAHIDLSGTPFVIANGALISNAGHTAVGAGSTLQLAYVIVI
jgi:hypothetical protein